MTEHPWFDNAVTTDATAEGGVRIVVYPPRFASLIGWWLQLGAGVILVASVLAVRGPGSGLSTLAAALVMALGGGLRALHQELVLHTQRRALSCRYVVWRWTLPPAAQMTVSSRTTIAVREVPAWRRGRTWVVELADGARAPTRVAHLNSPARANEVASLLTTAFDQRLR